MSARRILSLTSRLIRLKFPQRQILSWSRQGSSGAYQKCEYSTQGPQKFDSYRSHYCGKLSLNDEGKQVSLSGWVQSTRVTNFLLLRDIHGIVQVFLPDEVLSKDASLKKLLTEESVVSVEGVVRRRPAGQENPNMATGQIEVLCSKLNVISRCKPALPFTNTLMNRPSESIRLTHRYLDLRFPKMQQNLLLRSNFVHSVREFMHTEGFVDIETPTLFRRTPGGAREFIVPTNNPGLFYCLTQSPQQFKQLLMIAGMDKYYQIARCYRDESTRIDRQPEFTQIDIEMSFVTENDIIRLIERLFEKCWPLSVGRPKLPIRRMKYEEAMNNYGVDKPDVRFDLKLNDMTAHFKASKCGINRIDSLADHKEFYVTMIKIPKEYKELLTIKEAEKIYNELVKGIYFREDSSSKKQSDYTFLSIQNDVGTYSAKYLDKSARENLLQAIKYESDEQVLLLASKNRTKSQEIFGKLRLAIADFLDKKIKQNGNLSLLRDPAKFEFLWVVDFPLFTPNDETGVLESSHHPFTAPIPEHVQWVREKKNLEQVIGLHYDLVLNGNEIAGGSIRIHDADLQRHVLRNILSEEESEEKLKHLINALEYGAPPHGGIAIGLDRLVAILCGTSNIRDVIAFPKAQSGRDLMSQSPNKVSQEELDYYGIKCVDSTNLKRD